MKLPLSIDIYLSVCGRLSVLLFLVLWINSNPWITNRNSAAAQAPNLNWPQSCHKSLVFSHLSLIWNKLLFEAIMSEDKSAFQYKNKANCHCYEEGTIFQNIWCITTKSIYSLGPLAILIQQICSKPWEKTSFRNMYTEQPSLSHVAEKKFLLWNEVNYKQLVCKQYFMGTMLHKGHPSEGREDSHFIKTI